MRKVRIATDLLRFSTRKRLPADGVLVDSRRSQPMQISTDILTQCWFLAGPTASGKTDISIELAQRIDAEIVSLDSMSLYRGMDIGTSKPSPQQRQAIRHHLVDILEPHEEFSVAQYLVAADAACNEIVSRSKVPLFVGGTGLYLRAMLRGVFEGPAANWELREELERDAEVHGPQALHERLKSIDPQSAALLHPNDSRRVIRAIEVHEQTGRPLSEQQQQGPLPIDMRPQHVYWLSPPRDWLYERINRRVELMVQEGLFDEVRRLMAGRLPLSHTARQALGYKEVIDAIEAGGDPRESIELIQTRTRQFAKRQHTWFRNLEECRAIEVDGSESPGEVAVKLSEWGTR